MLKSLKEFSLSILCVAAGELYHLLPTSSIWKQTLNAPLHRMFNFKGAKGKSIWILYTYIVQSRHCVKEAKGLLHPPLSAKYCCVSLFFRGICIAFCIPKRRKSFPTIMVYETSYNNATLCSIFLCKIYGTRAPLGFLMPQRKATLEQRKYLWEGIVILFFLLWENYLETISLMWLKLSS